MRLVKMLILGITFFSLTACNSATPITEESALADVPAATASPTIPPVTAVPPVAVETNTPAPATATITITVNPTLPPLTATTVPLAVSPTPQLYTVEQYDTLLGIAIDFNVTVELLLAANGLSENDFLQIGQELIIPTGSDLTEINLPPTDEATSTPPPSAANPTAAPSEPAPTTETESAPPAPPPTAAPVASANLPTITHGSNINPLTGLPVDNPAVLSRRPLLVRIGNDVGARQSQVGFNSADMVYEEITEWWVTRFTAIFLANTPPAIGPVRSARLINVQMVPQYQGALAHSGGSDPVRWEISQAPIANLDEFYNPAPYFYRPNQGWQTRLAIDPQAARDYMAANNLDAPVTQQGFLFSNTVEGGELAPNIFIPYPRATSFTQWSYDAASEKYLRYIDDVPLVDAVAGQVGASNVIVYFAEHQPTDIVEDSNGATAIRIIVNGKGPAWFFRDGKLTKGFWETDGSRTPYFAYEDGRPYPLKPGNTWVQVVPPYFTIGLNSPDEAGTG